MTLIDEQHMNTAWSIETQAPERLEIVVPGPAITWVAAALAAPLAVAHFAGLLAVYGFQAAASLPTVIDLNGELNPATWFSSALHLTNAALLALIAGTSRRDRWRWWVLAASVTAVSLDETAAVHDRSGPVLRDVLGTSGWLTYAWVLPAGLLVAVVAALCVRVLLRSGAGLIVLLGAAVFLAGSMGGELVQAWWQTGGGGAANDLVDRVLTGTEESLEMGGAIIAMGGLFRLATGRGVRVRWSQADAEQV